MGKPQNEVDYFVVTLPWIIIIIGLFGNTFSAIIMLRKRFRNRSIGVYLLALAILDSIFLLSNSLFHWGIEILFDVRIQAISDAGCSIVKFVIVASRAMSAWILVTITVERMLALAVPHLSASINTKKRAIITTVVVVIIQLIIYSYSFKVSRVRTEWNQCWWSSETADRGHHLVINIADFINYTLIPSAVMGTANSVLIYLLFRSQEMRRSNKSGRDMRGTTLIIVCTSVAFIVLTMPMTVFQILFVSGVNTGPPIVYPILYALDLLNHAINFFFYCINAENVRQEIKLMFKSCFKVRKFLSSTSPETSDVNLASTSTGSKSKNVPSIEEGNENPALEPDSTMSKE